MAGKAFYNPHYIPNCQHMFLNYFHIAQSRQGTGGFAWPNYVDANGYPIADLPNTILYQVATEDLDLNYTGNYVIKWTGKLASMSCSPGTANFSVSSGNEPGNDFVPLLTSTVMILAGTNGRVVWKCGTLFNQLPFTFNAGAVGWDGTLNNLVMVKEADEAAWDAGQKWRQEYLDYIAYINPKGIRTMVWQPIIQTFCGRWAERCKTTEFMFGSERVPLSSWAGTLTGSQTYTCAATTDTPGSWTDGETFYAYVANANTADNPTINVGARGAKTIKTLPQGTPTLAPATVTAGVLTAGLYSFMYDSVNDIVVYLSGLMLACTPPEYCIDLANETSTDLFMTVPPFVNDDYVTQLTTLIRTTLNSGLKCYLEFCGNENWNTFSFIAGNYYAQRGKQMGLNTDQNYARMSYMGLRTRQTAAAATAAWSGRTVAELVRTTGVQIQGSTTTQNTYQFLGSDLGSYGYNLVPNRPIDYIDAVAGAPYIESAQIKQYVASYSASTPITQAALDAADDYAAGTSIRIQEAFDWLDNDLRQGESPLGVRFYTTLNAIVQDYLPGWQTLMGTLGKIMIGYEGAPGMIAPTTANCTAQGISTAYSAKFYNLITAYKASTQADLLMYDYLMQWQGFSRFGPPSIFTNIADDAWSMKPTLQSSGAGLETGFRRFNSNARPGMAFGLQFRM